MATHRCHLKLRKSNGYPPYSYYHCAGCLKKYRLYKGNARTKSHWYFREGKRRVDHE